MFGKSKNNPTSMCQQRLEADNLVSKEEYKYLKLKVDFFERSNRILHTYPGKRDEIMKMYAELLSRTLNYPVSIILSLNNQNILFGTPFAYIDEYLENLVNIKPFILVTSQNYPVMTFPNGFLVWHNPNYILTLDEDFLYTAVSQISLVEENLRYVESVADLSISDSLTGLYNRKYLTEALNKEMSFAKRYCSSFGFLIIDIDYFKTYNDTYGRQEGDKVLKNLAIILQETLREEDLNARYSGKAFCSVISQCDQEYLEKTAENIRALMELRLGPPITKRNVTVSVGGAIYPDSASDCDTLIKIADARLYRAKKEGKNRVICSGEVLEEELV